MTRVWPKIIIGLACLALIIFLFPTITNLLENNAEDPNWDNTHFYVYSVDEAIDQFGDDLLLDKLVLMNDYPVSYIEYTIEFAEGGNVNDRQSWRALSSYVDYGGEAGERFSDSKDHIDLNIFFTDDDPALVSAGGYRSAFIDQNTLTDKSGTTEINGTKVRYRDWSDDDDFTSQFMYGYCAEFEYNGNIYFLQTFSKENEALFRDTITQMLGS